jgi:hypothetical protein
MHPLIHIFFLIRVCEENRLNYTIHITLYVAEQLSVYKESHLKKSKCFSFYVLAIAHLARQA